MVAGVAEEPANLACGVAVIDVEWAVKVRLMALADLARAVLFGEHPVIVFSSNAVLSKDLIFTAARLTPALKAVSMLTEFVIL